MIEPTREYGYRDLSIIQDLRRQYLEPSYAGGTNDLALALRFYRLRQKSLTDPTTSAQLDQVFTNIVSGALKNADVQLKKVENNLSEGR